jgi:hypothetical protein
VATSSTRWNGLKQHKFISGDINFFHPREFK